MSPLEVGCDTPPVDSVLGVLYVTGPVLRVVQLILSCPDMFEILHDPHWIVLSSLSVTVCHRHRLYNSDADAPAMRSSSAAQRPTKSKFRHWSELDAELESNLQGAVRDILLSHERP